MGVITEESDEGNQKDDRTGRNTHTHTHTHTFQKKNNKRWMRRRVIAQHRTEFYIEKKRDTHQDREAGTTLGDRKGEEKEEKNKQREQTERSKVAKKQGAGREGKKRIPTNTPGRERKKINGHLFCVANTSILNKRGRRKRWSLNSIFFSSPLDSFGLL